MGDWLDPNKLNKVPFQEDVTGPVSIGFLVVFLAGFIVALALYLRPPASLEGHRLKRQVTKQFANWLAWAFGFGLTSFLFQLMGLPFLGWRLWSWVSVLVVVLILGYTIYYWQTSYRRQLVAYEAQQLKRAYLQQTRKRVGDDGQHIPRSPRAEKRRQRTGNTTARR